MPYNPSSAYPRHSTYTPPVYGRGFARGFNEFDWGTRVGHSTVLHAGDVNRALQRASERPTSENIAGALTAQNRPGLVMGALQGFNNKADAMRKGVEGRMLWNRAEYGDDPNEMAPAAVYRATAEHLGDINFGLHGESQAARPSGSNARGGRDPLLDTDPTPKDIGDPFAPKSETGGRAHVGGVSDRLSAIAQRVTTSSTMNDVAQRVLSGGLGGPMTVPKLVFGAARSANRRRKGGGGSAPAPPDSPF